MKPLTADLTDGAKIHGWLFHEPDKFNQTETRPAVIILAGGGYRQRAQHEWEPVMARFYAHGFTPFVVDYKVRENPDAAPVGMAPLGELAEAVSLLRRNACQWRIIPDQIAVLGFSAGGHLAASLGVHWQDFGHESRPDALVLCYPVTEAGILPRDSFAALCQIDEQRDYLTIAPHVTGEMPPTFLWHTVNDGTVPVADSLRFASALEHAGVLWEGHFYADGRHGLSLATAESGEENSLCSGWFDQCLLWLRKIVFTD